MVRGWYVIDCGDVAKIVRVDQRAEDTCVGEMPAGSSIGAFMDFIFDSGCVEEGDLLVLPDGSHIRLWKKPGPT